jgi:ABC-type phosphate/phosphonate transport system substrate-binding protein
MIANARMYSVSPEAAALWRRLLTAVIEHSGLDIELLDHADPEPISELWQRGDMAAVFMCGLPYSLSHPRAELIAAPVPAPPEFLRLPQYWSEMVVRKNSELRTLGDTFGGRIALTVPDSQSGCLAALYYLMTAGDRFPLYEEVIAPRITPLGAMSAVIDGAADIAPIDSYAYRLLQKYRPDLTSQLRVVARTAPTPIPPLVASGPGLGLEHLQAAFLQAHRAPAMAPLMTALLLERFVRPDPDSYDALRLNFAAASRYWHEHRLAATVHPAFAAAPMPFAGSPMPFAG